MATFVLCLSIVYADFCWSCYQIRLMLGMILSEVSCCLPERLEWSSERLHNYFKNIKFPYVSCLCNHLYLRASLARKLPRDGLSLPCASTLQGNCSNINACMYSVLMRNSMKYIQVVQVCHVTEERCSIYADVWWWPNNFPGRGRLLAPSHHKPVTPMDPKR